MTSFPATTNPHRSCFLPDETSIDGWKAQIFDSRDLSLEYFTSPLFVLIIIPRRKLGDRDETREGTGKGWKPAGRFDNQPAFSRECFIVRVEIYAACYAFGQLSIANPPVENASLSVALAAEGLLATRVDSDVGMPVSTANNANNPL